MDFYIKILTIDQNGDTPDLNGYRTPDKRWCPKRLRVARTSILHITEGKDVTEPRTLRFEEFKVSVGDNELMMVADIQHPTSSPESLLRERSLLDHMTPQKVKYQRSKKRRQ
jgi:hypothetical protein